MRFVRMLTSVAIAAGLGLSLSGEANASSVYGYARQELTAFDITTTATLSSTTALNTSTLNTAGITGFPASFQPGTADALQAYSGVPPAPAENSFGQKGLVGASWARGDAVVTTAPVINGVDGVMRNVAEGFLDNVSNGDGLGQWSLSYEFLAQTGGSMNITTNFSNQLIAQVINTLAGANVTSSYALTINLNCTPACGNQSGVFAGDPLNNTISQNGPGNGLTTLGPSSGSATLITPFTLVSGQTYTLTINADEHVSLTDVLPQQVIPEPGTWILMGTGLLGLLGYGWRRKRTA